MNTFEELELKKPLLESLRRINFIEPTEVQAMTIPVALKDESIMVKSKTGSGKTGAYLIPLIQLTEPKGKLLNLILVPTRELAIQVFGVFKSLGAGCKLKGALVYGGASISRQAEELRNRPEFVVGTPGRIKDMRDRGYLNLSGVERVVLDEADLMLDMGFYDDVEDIISSTKKDRRMLLFSATMTGDVKGLASKFMKDAEYINGEDEDATPATIKHDYVISDSHDKLDFLVRYIQDYNPEKAIIFSNTKHGASFLSDKLRREGFKAVQIHGDLSQKQREDSLSKFRRRERFLVATDVAARGVDIPEITHIINYDLPREDKIYIHRVGRTARFGKDGTALSIILPDEMYLINRIRRSAGVEITKLPMEGQAEEARQRRESNGGGYRRQGRKYQSGGRSRNSGRERSYRGNSHRRSREH
ncbi:MAG: DEAD/DEAH box helicase [Candidatus Thermoplasmatota archaeon]|nr:DEAD/DEAH box helicase [Candidatus Thermoplasmatota archaeon]